RGPDEHGQKNLLASCHPAGAPPARKCRHSLRRPHRENRNDSPMLMPAREQQHAIAAASEPLPKAEIRPAAIAPAAIALDGRFSSEEHLAFLTPQLSSGLRPEFHAASAQPRFPLRA